MPVKTNFIYFVGKTFGYWTVLGFAYYDHKKVPYVNAKCCCGIEKPVQWKNLKAGKTTNCGCRNRLTHWAKEPLYRIWKAIKTRCYKETHHKYKHYGGKGVTMCEEWKNSYVPFRDWCLANGWEKGLEVDKDKKGDGMVYSPENCTILTHKENTRLSSHSKLSMEKAAEIRKSSLSSFELAEIYGVRVGAIRAVRRNETWI